MPRLFYDLMESFDRPVETVLDEASASPDSVIADFRRRVAKKFDPDHIGWEYFKLSAADRAVVRGFYERMAAEPPFGRIELSLQSGKPEGEDGKIKHIDYTLKCESEEEEAVGKLLSAVFDAFNKNGEFNETGANIDQGAINELSRGNAQQGTHRVRVHDIKSVARSSRTTGNLYQRRVSALEAVKNMGRLSEWWKSANVDPSKGIDPEERRALDSAKWDVAADNIDYMYLDLTDLFKVLGDRGDDPEKVERKVDSALGKAAQDLRRNRSAIGIPEGEGVPDLKLYRMPAGHGMERMPLRTGRNYVVQVRWR